MPHSPTSSSRPCTPESSESYPRDRDSNSTPSPTGRRSSFTDSQILAGKLALLEASESLSEAAMTLSVAAQAMSKAAKSLALASSYLAEEDSSQPTRALSDYYYPTQNDRVQWRQPEYHLSLSQDTSDIKNPVEHGVTPKKAGLFPPSRSALDSSNGGGLDTLAQHASLDGGVFVCPPTRVFQQASVYDISENQANALVASRATGGHAQVGNEKNLQDTNVGNNPPSGSGVNTLVPVPSITSPGAPASLLNNTPASSRTAATTVLNLMASITPDGRSSVVLDTGFDQVPALCFLSQAKPKTVCFYRYWASAFGVGNCLKKKTNRPVIIPASLKEDKPLEAAKTFEASSVGVLLWPIHLQLPKIEGLESDLNTQIIYLGKPSGINADTKSTQVVVVLARSELVDLSAHERETFLEKYPTNENTPTCNDQIEHSALHSARVFLQSRLANLIAAREFCFGWLTYHRINNPRWSTNELVERANHYAQEFLLRGDSSTSNALVGGRISLKAAIVKSWKLEPAVESGLLLVE